MMRAYTGIVVAERPAVGSRPLVRFCPIGEPERRLRLTKLTAGEIGLLADEELDMSAYIGRMITVVGRAGRNWIYGVNEIRPDGGRTTDDQITVDRAPVRVPMSSAAAVV